MIVFIISKKSVNLVLIALIGFSVPLLSTAKLPNSPFSVFGLEKKQNEKDRNKKDLDIINHAFKSSPIISGTGTPGAQVKLTIGEETLTSTVNDRGGWSFNFSNLSKGDGDYAVTVSQFVNGALDSLENVKFTLDTQAPDTPNASINTTESSIVTSITGIADANVRSIIIKGSYKLEPFNDKINLDRVITPDADGKWSLKFRHGNQPYQENLIVNVLSEDYAGNRSKNLNISPSTDATRPPSPLRNQKRTH